MPDPSQISAPAGELRECELKLEKNKAMQEAARIDMDRGNLLVINGGLRLQLLEIEERSFAQRIEELKEKSGSKKLTARR